MNSLPSQFLIVNNEGVHRVYLSIEAVAGFDQMVAKLSQHRLIIVKNLGLHPNGLVHLAIHTRDGKIVLILEACKGTMGMQTQYHLVKDPDKKTEWLSPCFLPSYDQKGTFELRCEFDFGVWAESGLKMFFAVNYIDHKLQTWSWWKNQNYSVPFGNVFSDGNICLGTVKNFEEYFYVPFSGLDKLMTHLSSSLWNADAFNYNLVPYVDQLVRFDPKTLKMLGPNTPDSIIKMGIMGNITLAEVTKLIYG